MRETEGREEKKTVNNQIWIGGKREYFCGYLFDEKSHKTEHSFIHTYIHRFDMTCSCT